MAVQRPEKPVREYATPPVPVPAPRDRAVQTLRENGVPVTEQNVQTVIDYQGGNGDTQREIINGVPDIDSTYTTAVLPESEEASVARAPDAYTDAEAPIDVQVGEADIPKSASVRFARTGTTGNPEWDELLRENQAANREKFVDTIQQDVFGQTDMDSIPSVMSALEQARRAAEGGGRGGRTAAQRIATLERRLEELRNGSTGERSDQGDDTATSEATNSATGTDGSGTATPAPSGNIATDDGAISTEDVLSSRLQPPEGVTVTTDVPQGTTIASGRSGIDAIRTNDGKVFIVLPDGSGYIEVQRDQIPQVMDYALSLRR